MKYPLKICFFGDGESIHMIRWCDHFANLGYEVHLISFKKVQINGITTHFLNSGPIDKGGKNWKVLLKVKAVKKLLMNIKPDIFHAHYATSYGITGALCNYHPFLITTYGSDVLISGQKSLVYKLLLRYAFKKADWIQTLAPHMSEAAKKIGADPSKLDEIPFGIDNHIFNSHQRIEGKPKFTITSTRNHETVYNIPHLIKAVAKIKDSIPNIEFIIAGEGSLKPQLENMVAEYGLNDITTFTGKISQVEMVSLLKKTDIFATVSLSDGNSLSLAEAISCGAMCIASDIPANKQWIHPNKNGFLVSINDVDDLAEKILYINKNHEEFYKKSLVIGKAIIEESGIWDENMKEVEKKYLEFAHDRTNHS